jgi:ATP-dependent protease ClpP protease subunit
MDRMLNFLCSRRVFSLHSLRALTLGLALAAQGAQAQEAPARESEAPADTAPPAASPTPAAPAPVALPRGTRVMEIKGPIAKPLVQKIREALQGVEPNRFPAGAIVLIDSPGGDGMAALEIGRMLRAAKAHVFVQGRCVSACVYLLASGVVRAAGRDRAVGIHQARLAAFIKGLGVVDINSSSNPKAAAALEAGNRRTEEYFKEMGMPDALYAAIMAAPHDQTRYLKLAELPDLGLAGIDSEYRITRGSALAVQLKISEEEFERRTVAVSEKCLEGGEAVARTFVRCYRRVLSTGE